MPIPREMYAIQDIVNKEKALVHFTSYTEDLPTFVPLTNLNPFDIPVDPDPE